MEELSQKSRLLLEKGADYQNDIGFLTTDATKNLFNLPFVDNVYHFILFLHTLNDNSFSYQFFDIVEKKN